MMSYTSGALSKLRCSPQKGTLFRLSLFFPISVFKVTNAKTGLLASSKFAFFHSVMSRSIFSAPSKSLFLSLLARYSSILNIWPFLKANCTLITLSLSFVSLLSIIFTSIVSLIASWNLFVASSVSPSRLARKLCHYPFVISAPTE